MINFLKGKKTYLTAILGGLYAVAIGLGWLPNEDWIWALLGSSGLAFLRAGIKKDGSSSTLQLLLLSTLLLSTLIFLSGCTLLKIEQRDESPNERTITTRVTGTAWFSSAQSITKLKTITTDKTQTIGTDCLAQQGATNGIAALGSIARILEALRPAP